jgi:hypothetical protein
MAKKKLPKQVFVMWEEQPTPDDPFLTAAETWEEHARMGESVKVGVYQLVETIDVSGKPTRKP